MIQIKKKICKGRGKYEGLGCDRPSFIFSNGLCQYCYSKANKKTIKPKKQPTKALRIKSTGQQDIFFQIWESQPHISFISKINILEPLASVFVHVLAKGMNKYYKFKLYRPNIVLMTPEEHHLYDNGSEEQREEYAHKMLTEHNVVVNWDKLYRLAESLKDTYKKRYGV